jgi:endoglucanase
VTRPRRASPRRAFALIALLGVLAVGLAAALALLAGRAPSPPGPATSFIAPRLSAAALAADDGGLTAAQRAAAAELAAQPTAYWLTPERHPAGTVDATIEALAEQARQESAAFAVVVYGLPGRDCGNHSAGGLEGAAYTEWVEEIGAALDAAGGTRVVVLEPDSLALAEECGGLAQRAPLLRAAVDALESPGTWIYLDGGHSGWHSPERMAALIEAVGVTDRVRGFATNVSNYRAMTDELAYAHELSALLGGAHAVIDSSRSGSATADGEWCNPPQQRIGPRAGEYGDDVVDLNLWIKPPGESDGPCRGAPDAGQWWPDGAVSLLRAAS